MPYTAEDTLVQQTTADYLEQQLDWRSVYAWNNEDFGPDSLLGRSSEPVSSRSVWQMRFGVVLCRIQPAHLSQQSPRQEYYSCVISRLDE